MDRMTKDFYILLLKIGWPLFAIAFGSRILLWWAGIDPYCR